MSTAIMMVDMVFCEAVSFLPSIVAKTQLNAPMNEEFGSVRELSGWRRRIAHIDAVVTENVSSKKQSLGLIRDAPPRLMTLLATGSTCSSTAAWPPV